MIDRCNVQNKESRRIAGLSVFVFAAILAACTPRLPGDSDAALALEDIAAGFAGSRLKDKTPRPERSAVDFNIEGRAYQGDLYLSSQGTRAGIVLVPGVVPQGKDDNRIVALAQALPPEQVRLFVVDGLVHVDVRIKQQDIPRLLGAMEALLAQREHRGN